MNTISKKIVVLGAADTIRPFVFKPEGILIIGKGNGENDSKEIQSSLYVLKLLSINDRICGLIVVDKLIGELFLIQTETVVITDTKYDKLNHNVKDMHDLNFDILQLLAGIDVLIEEINLAGEELLLPQLPGGLYLQNSARQDTFTTSSETTQDSIKWEELYNNFISSIRILPDLEKLTALQNQINQIVQAYSEKSKEEVRQGLHLIDVIEDGLQRFALEEFSERTNIYELIWTYELRGSLIGARIVLKEKLN